MTVASIPSIFYEFAFNADPNQTQVPPFWTDLSARVQYGWTLTRGRQYELDTDEAGTWDVELANADGALDPGNAASPFAPNVLPYRPCRIRVVLGNNLLTPDAATAGEYAQLNAGPCPAWLGVDAFVNRIATIAQVGAAAYQGTRVWTTTVPSGTAGADLLDVSVQQVTAGTTYTLSAQVQARTSGQNPATYVAIGWIGTNGQTLSTTSGSPTTLTGAAGTWTQLSVTGQAPTGAVAALVRVVTTTTPTANSTIWCDALQLEARGYATRFQMPWTPGVNLLPQTIATGTETMSVATDSVASWFFAPAGTTLGRSVNLAAAPSGQSTAVQWTIPAGTYTNLPAFFVGHNPLDGGVNGVPVADCAQVTPGLVYTASAYATRTGTDATVNLTMSIWWFDANGHTLSIATGASTAVSTSGWTQLIAFNAPAPAGAAWGRVAVSLPNTTLTGTEAISLTGWQFEQGSPQTTWADPGPATFLFTGFVERFPRTWTDLGGTYGTSKLECVDATAVIAQMPLLAPFVQEVLLLGPNFFYQLNEPAGATSCADSAGKRPPAPVANSPYGPGSITFGSSVSSTSPGLNFVGTSGPVAAFLNNNANVSGVTGQLAETYIALHNTTTTPGPPRSGAWTRLIAVEASAVPTPNAGMIWSANVPTYLNANTAGFAIGLLGGGGQPIFQYIDNAGNNMTVIGPNNICDGNWHLLAISVDPTAGTGTAWVDNVSIGTATGLGSNTCLTDVIGCYYEPGHQAYNQGYIGNAGCAIELPFVPTPAQMTNLYNSWRSASSGESTGARYARILSWIGYPGATSIAAGSTASMGPATDTTGQTPLDALNGVAATENGESYVDAAGRLTFSARSALYGARTPVAVFGEARPVGNAGEWPCEVGSVDFDPSHLANVAQVTQYNGPILTGTNKASAQRYFSRLYQRTINTSSTSEAQDAANYLIGQLKDPHQRADAIKLHPAAIVGLFPILAQLDKNARVRYFKRPIGAPSTQLDGFIQRISWVWTRDTNDVTVEYQISPADLTNYWRIGALHTTLSAQAASGQANATINALPDAAVNKLAQSLPSAQTLWFEPGTARFEAVTVKTIPSTVLGYATATLVMNANFAFTHAAGSVVCEPLPTGYTDPTTWDASSVLGAAYAPILSGGASGTNSVTIGPLPDSAVNAVSSDWNVGDVVWLSSGVPARQEAATIASVATTYPGYGSCVLTFTANLTQNHNAGEYVSDPLPSNTINPATWTAPTTRVTY